MSGDSIGSGTHTPEERELARSAALIEQLLGDPDLRRRFREDAATVLDEHGLAELADGLPRGRRAMMTLELRESRSSLAGAMIGAAAEGVDLAHYVEHGAPKFGRGIGHFFSHLAKSVSQKPRVKTPTAPTAASRPGIEQSAAGTAQGADIKQAGAKASSITSNAEARAQAAVQKQEQARQAAAQHAQQQAQDAGTAPPSGSSPAADPTTAAAPGHHHGAGPDAGAGPQHAESAADLLRYPGNNASQQQIAEWMGAWAKKYGLPPELPVMAALTESGLKNLEYGDRDSVGFFQMRVGIWNSGQYAGFPSHPDLQIKWFLDHALAVKQQNPSLANNPGSWGEWVADVEQPAAQYRYRYQLQLGEAQALLAHADLGAVHRPHHHVETVGRQAVKVAEQYLGTPYQWGGSTPATGFDCSGLVQWSFRQEGIELPRVAAQQFDVGIPVARNHLQPGDAVFFSDPAEGVHHVGIYIGNDKFIDAPETGEDVRIDSLKEPYFAQQYAGARRYTAAALGNPSSYARPMQTVSHPDVQKVQPADQAAPARRHEREGQHRQPRRRSRA